MGDIHVHDVELNIEASLEVSGVTYKRKLTGNNESNNKDNRRKVQVSTIQTTSNVGTQTSELVAEPSKPDRVVTPSETSAGTGNGRQFGNRNRNRCRIVITTYTTIVIQKHEHLHTFL